MTVSVEGSYSDWSHVTSGVPQGSVLGPLLFILFVNDIPDNIDSSVKIFADDTKVWKIIDKPEDSTDLQNDLNKIVAWTDTCLLRLHVGKCKHMKITRDTKRQMETSYYIKDNSDNYREINTTKSERDLGILVTNDLKSSTHCGEAVKKANRVLFSIRKCFSKLSLSSFKIIYKTYARPHLDYCSQIWSPHLKKDINLIEGVQRRATKLVKGLRNLSYEERLVSVGLTTLKFRRTRGDLIETFKIMKNIDKVDSTQFFSLSNNPHLRGHSLKLFKARVKFTVRQNWFSQRVIDLWNKLLQSVIDAPSVNSFKNRLDSWCCTEMGRDIRLLN